MVTTSRAVRDLADRAGFLDPLRAFGGRITVDTCILATPMLPGTTRRLMTNSAKYAWYAPGLLGAEVALREPRRVRRIGPAGTGSARTGTLGLNPRWTVSGRVVIPGKASGAVLHADEPLSFWGGYDAATGRITDTHHPLAGKTAAGTVLVIPATRGSSTTTGVLLEAIRRRAAPVALITRGVDTFLTLACVVGQEMYGRSPALVAVEAEEFRTLADWPRLRVDHGELTRDAAPSGGR